MKSVSAPLQSLLASGRFITANLYTLTLLDGTAIRLTSAPDFDAVWDGHAFIHDSFAVERDTIKQAIGIEVDNVSVTLTTRRDKTLQGLPLPHFVRIGGFRGARMLIQRAYFAVNNGGNVNVAATGVIYSFEGRVAEPKPSRTQVAFNVVADTELLNKMVPLNTITPSCLNILFDGRCGKNKADFSHTGTVTTASKKALVCGLSQPDNYYRFGTVTFTSGQNAGAMRTVQAYSVGHFVFAKAFDYTPGPGDSFIAVAGCDLSEAVCGGTFDNLAHRRTFKFVPVYEENL
ncbi:baseplate hub domain-containing protein [Methylovulum psychrotolerans]|uniref:Bacteriophage phiJL001 Gp84 C-terminal domain-containing protein n=1 Tax=Methylovulum psychrotolerans TaxID=1704499 RepID=A0A1Z4C0E7_9GAMM|nr:DUF2163 domain-containing protein [Methylovulum psychrotolerans]ASF46993.1 hypothetical protein CEK71_13440 [Methylovulum psychrotolerans]